MEDYRKVICPYCQKQATFRSSKVVYGGRDYGNMYICVDYPVCHAYVGVHKGTTHPLGRLANAELRYWKKLAHACFDPLWQGKKGNNHRSKCYAWLAKQLEINASDCHIGMFDVDMCKRVVEICKEKLKE